MPLLLASPQGPRPYTQTEPEDSRPRAAAEVTYIRKSRLPETKWAAAAAGAPAGGQETRPATGAPANLQLPIASDCSKRRFRSLNLKLNSTQSARLGHAHLHCHASRSESQIAGKRLRASIAAF
jgi:hypothetical protein